MSKLIYVYWNALDTENCWASGVGAPTEYKQTWHDGVCLTVFAPQFNADGVSVHLGVSNRHRKALGFGRDGVGLVTLEGPLKCLTLDAGIPRHTSAASQHSSMDTNGKTVLVDRNQACSFDARFPLIPRPERANVVVEAKRIFSPNFLFVVTFELRSEGL